MVIVNADNLPPTQFASAFEAAGLDKKAYSPAAATITVTEWPTLGSLIDAGTTLVAFMASSADFTSVPWLIQEFGNVFEDAYGE
jgi:hypothetical protein